MKKLYLLNKRIIKLHCSEKFQVANSFFDYNIICKGLLLSCFVTVKCVLFFFILSHNAFSQSQNQSVNQSIIDSILTTVDSYNDQFKKIKVLTSNAGQLRYSKETRVLINKSISISKENNNAKQLANSYYSLGNFFFYNSQLDSSEYYLNKSISYVNDNKMPFLRASNLMTKSGIYRTQGNVVLAHATMLKSKQALDKIDTLKLDDTQIRKYKGESLVLNNALANYYNQMEQFDTASEYYDKAYKSSLSLKSYVNAGVIISNKGEMLLNQGNYKNALEHFEQGKIFKEKGNAPMRFMMSSALNIGNAHSKLKNYNDALYYLNKAHDHYKATNDTENLTIAKIYLGTLYFETKQYKLALTNCQAAKIMAMTIGNLDLTANACNCLFKTYKANKDFDKALENFELLTKTNDSIFNNNNIKKQTQQEMQYVFNKTEELNALELQAKEKQSRLYSYLAGLGLILALVLGFFYYKNRKKNILLAKQKKMLQKTVDEKNILLRETHHRVKNSFQMVSSLLFFQSQTAKDKEAKIAINEAQNRVRSMVLIHQKLYSKDQLVGIDSEEYITDFTEDVIRSHEFRAKKLNYKLNIESLVLDIETITPIGLILNELLTNVLKHAFPIVTKESLVEIKFHKHNANLILQVNDNGVGLTTERNENSFGLKLIETLAKKLKGDLILIDNSPRGTIATLTMQRYIIL